MSKSPVFNFDLQKTLHLKTPDVLRLIKLINAPVRKVLARQD